MPNPHPPRLHKVLGALNAAPGTALDIAAKTGLHRQNASRILSALRADGYATSARAPWQPGYGAGATPVVYTITPQGVAFHDRLSKEPA